MDDTATAGLRANEPLISIRIGADLMLIEGYARSLLWFRSPPKPLLIWQPVA
jgi:hypothetical protein